MSYIVSEIRKLIKGSGLPLSTIEKVSCIQNLSKRLEEGDIELKMVSRIERSINLINDLMKKEKTDLIEIIYMDEIPDEIEVKPFDKIRCSVRFR